MHFRKWCEARNLSALPATPTTPAAFIATEAKRGISVSSLGRRLCGIRYAHLLAGHSPPNQAEAVKATFRGVRRKIGSAPKRKEPITAERIRAMVKLAPDNLTGMRDLFPAEQDWSIAKAEKAVTDLAWVEAGEDFVIEGQVPFR